MLGTPTIRISSRNSEADGRTREAVVLARSDFARRQSPFLLTLYTLHTMSTLLALLEGGGDPTREAIVVAETGASYSYAQLAKLAAAFRDELRTRLGVGRGDVVASSFLNGMLPSFARAGIILNNDDRTRIRCVVHWNWCCQVRSCWTSNNLR